ncbi:uncharacterized protein LOC112345664 isoform X1 [Selaginella moellendorffii]|uniref:uncharacterized protein LOC112345664 isoform X1 n=1 Tax=Selaginella moellendorffii TaxID=88036 RepID=UPI000D1C232F|nr:uncharacterized protein LOC112345664 isoform X1 [Selaginella moellendorffii]|eukprot:XP_024528673.1 uncharacterized protein LOC112345664 isoform X1 [Selaginella moellendorffii]
MWPFVAGVFSCARAVPPTFRLARPSRAFPEALRSASRRRLGGDTSIHRKFAAAALQSATASNEKHDCKVLPGFTRRKEKKEGAAAACRSLPLPSLAMASRLPVLPKASKTVITAFYLLNGLPPAFITVHWHLFYRWRDLRSRLRLYSLNSLFEANSVFH